MEKGKIYLGIDWGEKRIGLALADGETRLAIPLSSVSSLKGLKEVILTEAPFVLVLGKPIKMSGESEKINPLFLNFLLKLKEEFPNKRIELVDERLTSKQADALPGEKKDKASRDEVAAMIILQSYLDRMINKEKCFF